jgi:hypothetical protein
MVAALYSQEFLVGLAGEENMGLLVLKRSGASTATYLQKTRSLHHPVVVGLSY